MNSYRIGKLKYTGKKSRLSDMKSKKNKRIYTSTSLSQYNRCPKLWYYYHIASVEPPVSLLQLNTNVAFGSAMHEMFEVFLRNKIDSDNEMDLEIKLDKYTEATRMITSTVFEVVEEIHPFINSFKPIIVESELYGNYEGISIGGKLDAIVEYNDELWVLDHKTSTRKLDCKRHQISSQFDIYCWLARKKGYNVKGVIINFLRIPSIKRKKEEPDDKFYQRVKDEIYEVETTVSNKSSYFTMATITKTDSEVQSGMNDISDEIYHINTDDFYRRNTSSCFQFNTPCEFFEVCTDQTPLDYLEQRRIEHPELALI